MIPERLSSSPNRYHPRGSNDLDLEAKSWRETRVGANFVFVLFIFNMSDTVSALKLFVRVTRLGSFSRAGLKFGLPQPSVSRIRIPCLRVPAIVDRQQMKILSKLGDRRGYHQTRRSFRNKHGKG
jgi:hypothetical protein